MKPVQLAEYPRLKNVLSPFYYDELLNFTKEIAEDKRNSFINLYSVFVDLTVEQSKSGYTALDIKNSHKALVQHYRLFIGFLWSKHVSYKENTKSHYSNIAFVFLNSLSKNKENHILKVISSTKSITEPIKECVEEFYKLDLPSDLLEYYEGWKVKTKEGKEYNVNLAKFNDTYGKELTDKVYNAISNFTLTQKSTTVESYIQRLTILFNTFTLICPSKNSLEENLQASRSYYLFEIVMNILFAESQAKGHDAKSFFIIWKTIIVKAYKECFVETGVFDEPLKPILTPKFKVPKSSALTFSIGGNLTSKETDRWLVDIPLRIKDEEVIEVIKQRLERDLTHIKTKAHQLFEEINRRQERNEIYRREGVVKPWGHGNNSLNYGFEIGLNNLKNTVATFYHYGFGKTLNYTKFLGFDSASELSKELSLPTNSTIYTLTALLILEHPSITPSWLKKWEMYDKSGAQVGFKQSNNLWVAVSYKDRRGARNSQQQVILNDYSKSIVETIVKHTQFTRESLKLRGDRNWRYTLLTATPSRAMRPHDMKRRNKFHEELATTSFRSSGEIILSEAEAKALSKMITHRSIRKAVGLQVYLRTNSLQAVAEALGHKKVNVWLLSIYLPKPLMDFFNSRWVRQFQNAIVFEAMKGSPYLFDAIDLSQDEITEFIENHGIGKLPDHLNRAYGFVPKSTKDPNDNEHIDEVTFTISTALLQLLIAIKTVVENADEEDNFVDIVTTWYESAVFILTSLSLESKNHVDVLPLLKEAKANPLNIMRFKENLLCR